MSTLHKILGGILTPLIKTLSKRRSPIISGELALPELHAMVKIFRDENGIAYIEATNKHDLYFVQGFTHAQERLWQMELNRRTSKGTLAEIFGDLALETDQVSRTFGFKRGGMIDYENSSDEVKVALHAYIEGINAWLHHPKFKLPIEFSLIKHKPQDWQIEDSAALTKLMVWQLSHSWYGELVRGELFSKIDEKLAQELEIIYPSENPSILSDGVEFHPLDKNDFASDPFLQRNMGSNSVVIAGKYTSTGKPILANDVHLAVSSPSLWYENSLHLKNKQQSISQTGVSIPGMPFVLIGQNSFIAFGITLAYTDCADVYLEKIDRANGTYEFKGETLPLTKLTEQIFSKDRKDPVNYDVFSTKHGIIVSDIISYASNYDVSVKDMALSPTSSLDGWYLLNYAENWDDYVCAMQKIDAPQLNIVYADLVGNIGYWCTGRVPIRAKGNGKVPVPGWSGEYEWIGEVPFEEMPHALNPDKGYIITTNNKVIGEDYPHYLGEVWMNGYRAARIEQILQEFITSSTKITPDHINTALMDVYCLPAVDLQQHIRDLQYSTSNPNVVRALAEFLQWDGYMQTDSVGALFYELIKFYSVKELFEPLLGSELLEKVMGVGFHPVILSSSTFFGQETVALLRILSNPESGWWEHTSKETVLTNAIEQAVAWATENLGSQSNWQWGNVHHVVFPHAFDITPPLDVVFNVPEMEIAGNTDTPYQTAMHANSKYNNNAWSISYRLLADLTDLHQTKAIHAPGQSGILGHAHYDDLVVRWLAGEYLEFAIENPHSNFDLLTLIPIDRNS